MSKISTAIRLFITEQPRFWAEITKSLGFLFPDKLYLEILYRLKMGRKLNLEDPKSYNEKLQWLKLYNHVPEYKVMVDKYEVKEYVAKKIGNDFIIPTYGVWNEINQINWESLPNKFVIKTTHGGGGSGVVICKDKHKLDTQLAKDILKRSMKDDIYKSLREWPYKGMKKRIIAEKLLEEDGQDSPCDYKVMCFNGNVKLIEFHEGRFSELHTQDFYDRDWNLTGITQGSYGRYNTTPSPKPALLDEMIRLSEILAEDIPHVRVDWYLVNNHLFFGEMTFFDGSGFYPFDRFEDDILLGSWITL